MPSARAAPVHAPAAAGPGCAAPGPRNASLIPTCGPRLSQGQLDLLARSGAPLWPAGTSGLTPAPVARVHDPSGVATHGVALWSAGHSRFRSARVVMALLVACPRPIPRLSLGAPAPFVRRPVMRPLGRTGLAPLPRRGPAGERPTPYTRAAALVMLSAQLGGAKVMPKNDGIHACHSFKEIRRARADQRVADLSPVIAELRASGVTSLHGIANELNRRGIATTTTTTQGPRAVFG
jgi:hypothetical protein